MFLVLTSFLVSENKSCGTDMHSEPPFVAEPHFVAITAASLLEHFRFRSLPTSQAQSDSKQL